jgi:hypothetical protein
MISPVRLGEFAAKFRGASATAPLGDEESDRLRGPTYGLDVAALIVSVGVSEMGPYWQATVILN